MITVHLADDEHFALSLVYPYAEKERIKALGAYPDVRYDRDTCRWVLHCALWQQVIHYLADVLAPIDPDVAMRIPIYKPKPVKHTAKSKQQAMYNEKRQLKQWGRFAKELKKWKEQA